MKKYNINKVDSLEANFSAEWNAKFWKQAEIAIISNYRKESETTSVTSKFKLQYDNEGVYGIFLSEESSIRAEINKHNSGSCQDSCVEFFVKPNDSVAGYLNFEFTPKGFVHCSHVIDWHRPDGNLTKRILLPKEDIAQLKILSSYNSLKYENSWSLAFFIPFSLLQKYFPFDVNEIKDSSWTGNFYKCGDNTVAPHWISWSPVNALNFHLPECFGTLIFQ